VGGRGKTALLDRFARELEQRKPPIPYARFDVENLRSPATAGREAMLRLRSDLEAGFHIKLPRFDLLLSVLLAAEGGPPPPLVTINPGLKATFNFMMRLVGIPADTIEEVVGSLAKRSETASKLLATADGRREVLALLERARRDYQALADELIDRFATDLADGLPARQGKACRAVLFFDTILKPSGKGQTSAARSRRAAWMPGFAGSPAW
jgi:hypothetical protein